MDVGPSAVGDGSGSGSGSGSDGDGDGIEGNGIGEIVGVATTSWSNIGEDGRWYAESPEEGWVPLDGAYDRAIEAAYRRGEASVCVVAFAVDSTLDTHVRFLRPVETNGGRVVEVVEAVERDELTGRTLRALCRFPAGEYVWQVLDEPESGGSNALAFESCKWKTYPNTDLIESEYRNAVAASVAAPSPYPSSMGAGQPPPLSPARSAEIVALSASGEPVHMDLIQLLERNVVTGVKRRMRRVPLATLRGGSAPSSYSGGGIGGDSGADDFATWVRDDGGGGGGGGGEKDEDDDDDEDDVCSGEGVGVWRRLAPSDPTPIADRCPICHDDVTTMDYAPYFGSSPSRDNHLRRRRRRCRPSIAVVLTGCSGHAFHARCVRPMLKPNGSLRCPLCWKVSGAPHIGTQPDGTMTVMTLGRGRHKVCGLEECGVIVITYLIPPGLQGMDHPRPGMAYHGTERKAYLPDTEEGKEVLSLLRIAWERRLIFKVGMSVSTGREDCVVWAGIHHKTCSKGGPHGYPDDTYLERIKVELAVQGVS